MQSLPSAWYSAKSDRRQRFDGGRRGLLPSSFAERHIDVSRSAKMFLGEKLFSSQNSLLRVSSTAFGKEGGQLTAII